MQSKKAVQVEDLLARNSNTRAHLIISWLGVRNHNVQSVCCPALENYDQARVRNEGMAAVPTTAIAPPLRNVRRVMFMMLSRFLTPVQVPVIAAETPVIPTIRRLSWSQEGAGPLLARLLKC